MPKATMIDLGSNDFLKSVFLSHHKFNAYFWQGTWLLNIYCNPMNSNQVKKQVMLSKYVKKSHINLWHTGDHIHLVTIWTDVLLVKAECCVLTEHFMYESMMYV